MYNISAFSNQFGPRALYIKKRDIPWILERNISTIKIVFYLFTILSTLIFFSVFYLDQKKIIFQQIETYVFLSLVVNITLYFWLQNISKKLSIALDMDLKQIQIDFKDYDEEYMINRKDLKFTNTKKYSLETIFFTFATVLSPMLILGFVLYYFQL